MEDIRKDIFPRMVSFLKSKEAVISSYVTEAHKAVSSQFPTMDQFIKYINSLDSHETAELFIKTCKFYFIAKKYQPTSYVKLIMIISAIERVISKDRDYQEFHQWILREDEKIEAELPKMEKVEVTSFKEVVRALEEEYFKIYSSRRNIIDFFQNHLNKNNKIKLIKSFRRVWTNMIESYSETVYEKISQNHPNTIEDAGKQLHKSVEKGLMPYCYDWRRCWVQYGKCAPDVYCEIANDNSKLQTCLRKVVSDLYQMRNDFVHSARITPLNAKDSIGTLSVLGADRKPISIELTATDLESIFENGLKHYFDSFVK